MFSNVGIVAIGNEEIVEFCLPIGVTEEILPEIKLVILSYDYKYKCLYLNDWKLVVEFRAKWPQAKLHFISSITSGSGSYAVKCIKG